MTTRIDFDSIPSLVPDRVYNLDEAALVSRVCRRTLWSIMKKGRGPKRLPAGGCDRVLILGEDLIAWLRSPAPAKVAEAA